MTIYDYENRLIVCVEDACAIWQTDAKQWTLGSVELAREAWMDGKEIARAEAEREFPSADFATLPDLTNV